MLALRQWQNRELLDRIGGVDTEDFKNAMLIIDLLVDDEVQIELDQHEFSPGSDVASILHAELRMEKQLASVIGSMRLTDERALARLSRAAAPRQRYREWLEAQIVGPEVRFYGDETGSEMREFIAHLLALVEQAMLHAFLFRHLGRVAEADNAWRLSGAAMLFGAALVRRGAASGIVPTPGKIPAVCIGACLDDAFKADMALVRRCADLGRAAAEAESREPMQRDCRRIITDCDLIAGMQTTDDFPGVFGRSQAFESFAATCERHLA
jgi:bacterioferritin (cytochrome b1)